MTDLFDGCDDASRHPRSSTSPQTRGARHRFRPWENIDSRAKGQRARTGSGKRPGFEGGRNPLIRRLPKRGFRQKATGRSLPIHILNVDQLNRCADGERLTPERLKALGLIKQAHGLIKLLGDGALKKRLGQ